jgi:hypothetical protein
MKGIKNEPRAGFMFEFRWGRQEGFARERERERERESERERERERGGRIDGGALSRRGGIASSLAQYISIDSGQCGCGVRRGRGHSSLSLFL